MGGEGEDGAGPPSVAEGDVRVLDLFAGTGSATAAFREAGHEVVRVELDRQHEAEFHYDIGLLTAADLPGPWDFIWASPPCQGFSVASIGRYWTASGVPKHPVSRRAIALVEHTLRFIADLAPRYWLVENPRGMLRSIPLMVPYERRTVTYCQYGDERMKPTDLWGVMPVGWTPKPPCKNGASCHVAAPRGSKTGTQGRKGAVDRSRVPYDLSREICQAVTP